VSVHITLRQAATCAADLDDLDAGDSQAANNLYNTRNLGEIMADRLHAAWLLYGYYGGCILACSTASQVDCQSAQ
jgi:hypothetical protein